MQVLSATTDGKWLKDLPPPPPPAAGEVTVARADPAKAEADRVMTEIFHCDNLIVLAGLGTSLDVKPVKDGGPKAPTMGDLWTRVEAQTQVEVGMSFADFLQSVGHPVNDKNIEALLSRCRLAEAFFLDEKKARVSTFVAFAERTIASATDFIATNQNLPVHEQFLRRLARRSSRKQRAKLFTTNYDRCFEEAARQARLFINDGFSFSVPATFDASNFNYDIVSRGSDGERQDYIPNLLHLYKVHGSIDWERDPDSKEVHKVAKSERPLLIYPRNSKYEMAFEPPYLEMIAAFQNSLRQSNVGVLIVGFGFNDNHLAEPILSAVRSNLGLKLVVVGPRLAPYAVADSEAPAPGEANTNQHLIQLARLARAGDARISLINESFNGLLQYVPDLVADSDREKHVARLRSLGKVV
ncbi:MULTISPECIES: SIR2 family protein [unclassified Luteibacter]|uniref:SIR2 family protein n=1 Tax=Luteibacter sp. PvP019 TaxID=3156436 RepID=UPI003391EAEB